MSGRPVIRCRGITVAYGRDIVLDRIDLTVPRGILLPVVGANGAGKSTLLKVCLGLVPFQAGEMVCDFGEHPPAYVPQQKHLDPVYPLTTLDLVRMGLYPELGFWGWPDRARRARVEHVLTRFGLAPHREKRFGELSGGLRQKTLLARAVVAQAEVLVLDEPMAGLDAASEADMLALIRMLHEEGKTILWVHHKTDVCATMAKQICRVDNGNVRIINMDEVSA